MLRSFEVETVPAFSYTRIYETPSKLEGEDLPQADQGVEMPLLPLFLRKGRYLRWLQLAVIQLEQLFAHAYFF